MRGTSCTGNVRLDHHQQCGDASRKNSLYFLPYKYNYQLPGGGHILMNIFFGGDTVGQWLALPPLSKKVVGLVLGLGPFCAEFAGLHVSHSAK